ncbi:nuclear transcription factor Y subunit A-3-like isoform X2 [Solanum dulcamara]|uniref:nuclear transcription factor Y subunit A-3-like isoform X2 n=1 Tax=Solanum dulcamara TaxID=45834 RepID=UPI002485637A|nr:nuclear transcription factor Y subunit A-3-like isoform X2 [Solanum dulcamara]
MHVDFKVKGDMKSLDPHLQGKTLQLTHSTINSRDEMTASGKTNSQDQCASSEYVHDERYGRDMQVQIKPALFSLQNEVAHSTGFSAFDYSDPYISGLYTAYGPQPFPPMMGIAPARVPLPGDVAEDGPIYVNAKQYHGILRRRQIRAKLEAQNKLVKNRKPYLHESRHLHAVNRVRGSGGRFLSSKKVHQSDPNCYLTNSTSSRDSVEHEGSTSAFSSVRQDVVHNGISFQQQPDHMAFSVSSHMDITMQGNGTQQRAPVVR